MRKLRVEKFEIIFDSRVRLSKRRLAGGSSKVANLRLVQRYRPFTDAEEKIQVDRFDVHPHI